MSRCRLPHVPWRVVALLAALGALLAPPVAESAADGYGQPVALTFPTVPSATFSDDYHVPRGDGDAHRATDLFAAAGSPVYAARGGTVTWVVAHPSAGWAVHVRGDDGRTYAYYHLGPAGGARHEAIAAGVVEGATVARGQKLGVVGDSGNAVGGPPHLHFEIHDDDVTDPYDGPRRNPVASLRAALARGDLVGAGADAPVLRRGDRGPRVVAWQQELSAHRAEPVSADGVFGPRTEEATRALQRRLGVGADGVVGPRTRAVSAAALPPDSALLALLRAGDRGPRVAEWQQQLDAVLAQPVAVDGIFGPQTALATRELQRGQGIGVDGVVGPHTRQAMADALR